MAVAVAFYQAAGDTPAALDAVLPALLEKAVGAGNKVLLVAPTAARRQRLDEALWSYADTAFLPHGTPEDGKAVGQPVLLVSAEEEVAEHLAGRIPVVLAGAEAALDGVLASVPERVLYMFSTAEADVARGRALYKDLKGKGCALTYFQRTERGWERK